MNDTHYAYIVIGRGLLGAAATRHLAAESQRVAVIGPEEPPHRASHQGIFGSHYDEGRITRILDPAPTWARLAQRSLARYREIEAQSGVPFYHEVGHLMVGAPGRPDQFVERVQQVAADLDIEHATYTDTALGERFPYLSFEAGGVGMYQPHSAGHVSPRRQVRAQATAAQKQGAALIPETVNSLQQTAHHVILHTDAGHTYRADKVLLATGGFSNGKQLLSQPLDIRVNARTIVLMEIDALESERLRQMPSIIYKPRDLASRCYILPPIRYPNGKIYIKIGGGYEDPPLHTLAELQAWFRSPGSTADAQRLTDILHATVRDLRPLSTHSEACVTTDTPTGQVYAERLVGGRVGVLVGGNGSAAKSADEIGRMGALMMQHDDWAYDLPPEPFKVRFACA